MKNDSVRLGIYRHPFRKKCLGILVLVCGLGVFASGSDDVQVNEDDTSRLIKQAEKMVRRGRLPDAEKLLQKVIAASPGNSTAKLRLAFIYVKQRRLSEAYVLSYNVAKAEPKNSHAFAVLGATLLSAGKFSQARAVNSNSLLLSKKEDLAWAGFGMLDFYENRIPESLANLREAIRYNSDEADYYFAYAQVAARSERYKEAAEAYYRFLAVSREIDDERRARIRGLIDFLRYIGQKPSLYTTSGAAADSVPFELRGNRPFIQLRVNGSDELLNFVLDTGSGISVISDETAKRLGIGSIAKGGSARGIGGDGKFDIIYGFLRQVNIGDVKIRNVPVYIRKFHNNGASVDGYIGLSLISKFLTTIDYGDLTFSLAKKEGSDAPLTDQAGISLPLRLTSSGFLSGEVQLEGVEQPLNFIVDTGASVSVISDDVALMEGITPFATAEKMRVIGSAGITENVPSFLLPKVSFGKHSRKSIAAIALDLDMINEASGFEQAGILGGNFLRNYRMTFDFTNSMVTFVPIDTKP
ncbi:MAG: aspartyl protease family protein [Pyrinomonadaceae bacterium]